MKRLIIDLDDTLAMKGSSYENAAPNHPLIQRLREYKMMGFEIAIHTARNVRTYQSNVGKINANTLPVILEWLKRHEIPYDEVYVGKPWCGLEGFYVDDRAVRPDEFVGMSFEEITALLKRGAESR